MTYSTNSLPAEAVGLRLCKMVRGRLIIYESIMFKFGRDAVDTTLRRAAISGAVGPLGDTGEFWADILKADGDWMETIALSRESWNSLKNRWMRCRLEA